MKTPYTCPEEKRVRVVFDMTEADEMALFSLAHCIASPEFVLCGVIAHGKLANMAAELASAAGVELRIEPDADFVLDEAENADKRRLYLVCVGSLKNAAALLGGDTRVKDSVTVLWTGGGETPESDLEPNYAACPSAAESVMATGAEVYAVPMKAYQKVRVSLAQLQLRLTDCGAVGKMLFDMLCRANEQDVDGRFQGEAWLLQGEAAVSVLLCPEQRTWTMQAPLYGSKTGRPVRVYGDIDNRMVLEDMFAKMRLCFAE